MEQKLYIFFFLVLLSATLSTSSPVKKSGKPATCNNCHPTVEGKINIHIVPHSHDDVGWLKTVDQYYYGSGTHNTYEGAGVQYIISSAISALQDDPSRRYIQVETAFFWQWWNNQNESVKNKVVELLNTGQLEIINGAWSMNDEAAAHYQSVIDQYTWGFRRLNDTLGECSRPKFSWQIDPFGHSREQASLLRQMGFHGLLVGRIDYRDKNTRIAAQNLDFFWRASQSLDNADFFTTTYPDGYISEGGFCFDVTCGDAPINDNEDSPDYNLKEKMDQFISKLDQYKNWYKTPNILIPMGGDFYFQAAEINFLNLDKLIKAFKNHPTYNVIYSTPSCYMQAVNAYVNTNNIPLTTKEDDFFPYASGPHSYWTGYFSSRPTSKRFERQANNILQSAKQLSSLSAINGKDTDDSLVALREAMGILQHHDAITGTEKQHVANDYARLLAKGIEKAEQSFVKTVQELLVLDSTTDLDLGLTLCLLSNVTICEPSSKDKFLVVVQNPLSHSVNSHVRLPVSGTNFKVSSGIDGTDVLFDILDPISDFAWLQLPTNKKELVFRAEKIPPLGLKVFYVEKIESLSLSQHYKPFTSFNTTEKSVFGGETTQIEIDAETGRLSSVTINGKSVEVNQEILYYSGYNGQNNVGDDSERASGAYVFRPSVQEAFSYSEKLQDFKVADGDVVTEVLQVVSDEVVQIIRVYKDSEESYVEFDWLVGNLQFTENGDGKEVINRITVKDFENGDVFFTDSNGREQLRRELNKRPDFEYPAADEPTASNYYPVTARIAIKDEGKDLEVALLNDRAQGGSSLGAGQLEVLIHRRLPHDDAFGVDEALNEEQYGVGLYARGQHYLTLGSSSPKEGEKSCAALSREIAVKKRLAPLVLVGDATGTSLDSLEKVVKLIKMEFEGLTESLPENVLLLTLEPWKEKSFIVRLEHLFEVGEDAELSQEVTVNLENLFTTFDINDLGETVLGANQWMDDYEDEDKLEWSSNGVEFEKRVKDGDNPLEISLKPMEIRTFIVRVAKK